MKRSGKILLEGTIEEFKKHCKGADNREYLLINTKEIKKDGTYAIYQQNSNTERVISISHSGKYGRPFIPYDKQYLTFIAKSDGTFKFSGKTVQCTIQYSTDYCATWSEPSQTVEIDVKSGDEVRWKGEMTPSGYKLTPSSAGIGGFGGTAKFDVQGNIMSLLYGDNFIGQTSLEGKEFAFQALFFNTESVNANNLSLIPTVLSSACYCYMFSNCSLLKTVPQLPATVLSTDCYWNMFSGCPSLVNAPILPATTLAESCYSGMFNQCTNLSQIEMLATDISANDCLRGWVEGVAETGTFVRAASMTSLPTGDSGIPEGWEVEPPLPFFCKLTLNNGDVVEIEGSGELTSDMTSQYLATTVSAEVGELCTSIGNDVFFACASLTSVTIGNSVTSIGDFAFQSCTSLTSITIPNGVTSIGDFAFQECILTSITSLATTAPAFGFGTFANVQNSGVLRIPQGSSGYDAWLAELGSGWTIEYIS